MDGSSEIEAPPPQNTSPPLNRGPCRRTFEKIEARASISDFTVILRHFSLNDLSDLDRIGFFLGDLPIHSGSADLAASGWHSHNEIFRHFQKVGFHVVDYCERI